MPILTKARFYLELIALPFFIYLVIHMGGHGLMLLVEPDHDHGHHVESTHHEEEPHADEVHREDHEEEAHEEHENEAHQDDHDEAHDEEKHTDEEHHEEHNEHHPFINTEVLGGVLLLIFFAWIWHRPALRKWVPCIHECCDHDKVPWTHILATFAFVLHFFPEAEIRHNLLEGLSVESFITAAGLIAFAAHFLVDIIVGINLSLYWHRPIHTIVSFLVIVGAWVGAFMIGEHSSLEFHGTAEGILMLVSAFLLSMFVHKPHRTKPNCK